MFYKVFFVLLSAAVFLAASAPAQDRKSQEIRLRRPLSDASNQAATEALGGVRSIFNFAQRTPWIRRPRTNAQVNAEDAAEIEGFKDFVKNLNRLRGNIKIKRRQRNPKAENKVDIERVISDVDREDVMAGKRIAEKEGLWNTAKTLHRVYKAYQDGIAKKEDIMDYWNVGKKLYKAYKAYQDGIAEKENFQKITGEVYQANQVTAAGDDDNEDDIAEEEAIFTIPSLLFGAYKAYQALQDG